MQSKFWMAAAAACLLMMAAGRAQEGSEVSPILSVSLNDGSRVVGTTPDGQMNLHTDFGRFDIPLKLIRNINFGGGVSNACFHLRNGDRLTGRIEAESLTVATTFGELSLPIQLVVSLSFSLEVPPEGIVLYLPFDGDVREDVHDASGRGNNGKVKGARYVPDGKRGGAFQVGRGLGYIELPDRKEWALGTNDFSICLWIKFHELNLQEDCYLLGHSEGSGERKKWAIHFGKHQTLSFHINNDTSTVRAFIAQSSWKPVLQRWYHLAVTRDNGLYTIYVDGERIGSGTNASPIPDAKAPLTLGQADNAYFAGCLDEVMLFHRALPPAELEEIIRKTP